MRAKTSYLTAWRIPCVMLWRRLVKAVIPLYPPWKGTPDFPLPPYRVGVGRGVGASPLPCSLAHLHALGRWLSMQCSPCRHPHILWSEDCILRIQYAKPLTHCAAMVCLLVQLNRITILLSWAYPCRMKRGSLFRLHYPALAGLYSLHTAFA